MKNRFRALICFFITFWAGQSFAAGPVVDIFWCQNEQLVDALYSKIYEIDQGVRKKYGKLISDLKKNGKNIDGNEEVQNVVNEMVVTDLMHQMALVRLVDDCGWPKSGNKKFEEGSAIATAYLVAQHSDLDYHLYYYPMVQTSYLAGDIPEEYFVYYINRMLNYQGKPVHYNEENSSSLLKKEKVEKTDVCKMMAAEVADYKQTEKNSQEQK